MTYKSCTWGRVRSKISENDNICATDLRGTNHVISKESLPNDIGNGDHVSDEYTGMVVAFRKKGRVPCPLVNPKFKQIPDELSGPFYLPESGEIVELDEVAEEDWKPPETNRDSKTEWDGTKQNVGSNDTEKRKEIFDSNTGNKNNLL